MHAVNPILLAVFWTAQLARWGVWVGLVVLTVALLLLMRTRWGQSQPLGKCVVLSLLAHLLLAIYLTTVNIVTASSDAPASKGIQVALSDGGDPNSDGPDDETKDANNPWDAIAPEQTSAEVPAADLTSQAPLQDLPPLADVERTTPTPGALVPLKLPDAPPPEEAPAPEVTPSIEPVKRSETVAPQAVELPAEPIVDPNELVPPPDPTPPKQPTAGTGTGGAAGGAAAGSGDALKDWKPAPVPAQAPAALRQRMGDHLGGGSGRGGTGATRETEAAVTAALRYLVAVQSADGRWDPRRLNGGGLAADGEDRQGAGTRADTALTGLALLAFLASGHTHLEGEHRETVRRGLEFLLVSQEASGCLGATSNTYERMYCHAMASCALSEAYAMTRDKRLLTAVRNAIDFSVRTQDRPSGGWRYLVGQSGDTSQLGWQVMALKSAELGGISMPAETRAGIERFLRSVASGTHGGLASYQPTRPVVTRSMTAEAMVCRQFLGRIDSAATLHEGSNFVMQEMPGAGAANHYYWYYGTLALYQAQGEPWQRWNDALRKTLLASQRTEGALAGSWDPDPVWGRCGGRVYSTALCTLCLEVYYRFLPLYVQAARK